ncbi:hypothetical protein [Arthrospira platensis]|jgi:hypothetical protein|nr:hypothetical protein [Arthrospira platensis]MBD2668436.1 hypothetical protein [Arthrospira platensis FACHB-439]MBD2711415.1 hypothetical protein [Arthrospira platensis FACHB-835]MDF2212709.1 hypothetical protein [Arthrospira platensis NCB002]QQW31703.1 hypothetical protein AP9108_15365 [Arthrospira sp. PCC 9108]BAI91037.1 hypothetical protein NIES39_H01120 [Arthrospira platensis NIES-39]
MTKYLSDIQRKIMLKKLPVLGLIIVLIAGLVFGVGTAGVLADTSLPQPNDNGDYIGNSNHLYWQVVDPDPNGLNCRMGSESIKEVWNPEKSGFPRIINFPVVERLQTDEVFTGKLSYGGFIVTLDSDLKPWIYIEEKADATPANCFVRANDLFIKPIEKPALEETLEETLEEVEEVIDNG